MTMKWHTEKDDGIGVGKCAASAPVCSHGGDSEHCAMKREGLVHLKALVIPKATKTQATQESASAGNGSLPATVKRSANDSQSSLTLDPQAL